MEQHNLQFWFDVEDFKYNKDTRNMKKSAKLKKLKKDAVRIFQDFISSSSPREINVDTEVRQDITVKLNNVTNNRLFDLAQLHILTQLGILFKDQYVLSHTVKALLHTLKSLRDILPNIVVDGEAETVPLPTGDDLGRMLATAVHIMTLMEFLHSSNAPEKRPLKAQFLKFEDEDRIVKMGVKYLLFFAALKTHMDKEKSQENLMFWLDAEDFRSLDFGAPREDDAEHEKTIKRLLAVRATHIVRRYVDDDAEMLVNLPGHITKQIKISLAELQEAAKAPASKRMDEIVAKSQNMFDAAQREILVLMKRDSWRRFHASSEAMNIRKLLDKLCVHEEFEDPERTRTETRLHNRFDLTSDERLVRSFTCALEKKMLLHGQLYITKRHVCFFSTVFGFKTKLCYNFSEIWEISNVEAQGSGKKRGVATADGSVVIKTTDKQVHVFSHVLPSHNLLLYVFRKARQRLEKGHDDPTPSTMTLIGDADEKEDEDNTKGLNEKDWEMLKEGAAIQEYKTGGVVLEQGSPASSILQIARGTVSINKKTTQGNTVTIRTCSQGEVIGEISFVEGGTASASVVAASDDVVIYFMSRQFIENALVKNPGLPGRFYRYVATLLADRLRTKKNVAEVEVADVNTALTDSQFYTIFALRTDVPILNRWTCAIKSKSLIMYGTLFLLPSALCFYSKVLGSVKKRIIALGDVTHVGTNKNTLILTHRTVDSKSEFVHMEECMAARDAIQSQISESRKSTSDVRDILPPQDEIDWTMFLSGAELKRYDKGEPILEQGSPSRFVFQIASGEATAQRQDDNDGSVQVFRKLLAGEMFGEMSFLQEHPPSASIVASQDNTMVYNIDKKFVDSLLELNPELPGRFYKFLAQSLATRLRN